MWTNFYINNPIIGRWGSKYPTREHAISGRASNTAATLLASVAMSELIEELGY